MLKGIELPVSAPIRKGECRGQVIEKVAAGDFFGAEGHLHAGRIAGSP